MKLKGQKGRNFRSPEGYETRYQSSRRPEGKNTTGKIGPDGQKVYSRKSEDYRARWPKTRRPESKDTRVQKAGG